jgi:rRNA maturation endonuclease Nob1
MEVEWQCVICGHRFKAHNGEADFCPECGSFDALLPCDEVNDDDGNRSDEGPEGDEGSQPSTPTK